MTKMDRCRSQFLIGDNETLSEDLFRQNRSPPRIGAAHQPIFVTTAAKTPAHRSKCHRQSRRARLVARIGDAVHLHAALIYKRSQPSKKRMPNASIASESILSRKGFASRTGLTPC